MALLHEAVETKKLDVRMVERNVARGVITAGDVEQSIKALPDDSANADWVDLEALMNDHSESSGNTHH